MAFRCVFYLLALTLPGATAQSEENCVSEGKADDSEVLLLQTAFQTATREENKTTQEEPPGLKNGTRYADSQTLSFLDISLNSTVVSYDSYVIPGLECQRYRAVEDRLFEDSLHLAGLLKNNQACSPSGKHRVHQSTHVALLDQAMNATYEKLSEGMTEIGATDFKSWLEVTTGLPAISVFIMTYVTIYVLVVLFMLGSIFHKEYFDTGDVKGSPVSTPTKLFRPESEAWSKGVLYWLFVSWATPWIVRWGIDHDGVQMSRIKSEDLGQYGDEEDDTTETVGEFERLFAAQAARDPRAKESLSWTMVAYASKRRLVVMILVTSCHQACLYLGPVVLIDCTMRYLHNLALQRQIPGMVTNDTLLGPLMCLVGGFLGLPLMTAMTATISFLINLKLNLRLMGALAAAIFRKAQRLPLNEGDRDLDGHGKLTKEQAGERIRSGVPQQHYSIVRLIASDVDSLLGIQFAVAKVFALIPIVIVLAVMLYMKLKLALFAALGTSVLAFMLFMRVMGRMIQALMSAQSQAGIRLSMMQETMFSIRLVKSCAWEEPFEKAVNHVRNMELDNMYIFWFYAGLSGVFFTVVARATIFASVGSFAFFYTDLASTDVFTMMQILNAFRNAVNNFSQTAPVIMNAGPSVLRISNFLKLDEAAVPGKKEASQAPWVKVWPEAEARTVDEQPMLRVKGSFLSTSADEDAAPLLHDLDISIAKGELVAVLGEVGSGKSVLLQALLGELKPTADASLEIPSKIAYHAQVPVICEATLRENVIYWSGKEEETRYQEAICAASLVSDLQVLPGGDRVLIGSRGISLSGGQKARVSLARAAYNIDAEVVLLDDPFASVMALQGSTY